MFGGEEMFYRTGNSVAGMNRKCRNWYRAFLSRTQIVQKVK